LCKIQPEVVNPFSRRFGAVVASELMIFAMMIQIYRNPSMVGDNNTWFSSGCVVVAFFLLLAAQLATP